MDKTKLIPILLFIIVLAVGGIAFKFFSDKKVLSDEVMSLKESKKRLDEENNSLKRRYSTVEQDKKALEVKTADINQQLARISKEKDELEKMVENVTKERDELTEKLKAKPEEAARPQVQPGEPASKEYWEDFVQTKAELEVKVEDLNKELAEAKNKLSEMDKQNKEFTFKMDELVKENERFEKEAMFRKRTLDILSKDLVLEREEKKNTLDEITKLREENFNLKQDITLTNREKTKLQADIADAANKRETLEKQMDRIKGVLQEKAFVFDELRKQLSTAITGEKKMVLPLPGGESKEGGREMVKESGPVELPPIVVKPQTAGVKGLQGEIIAVNEEEKFVVIDIGEDSGIKPGMQMKAMRQDKEIGTIEIIETRQDISAADIKEVIGDTTIEEGDMAVVK